MDWPLIWLGGKLQLMEGAMEPALPSAGRVWGRGHCCVPQQGAGRGGWELASGGILATVTPPDCSSQPDAVSEMSNQAHLSLIGWMQRHEQRRSTPLPILLCACPRPHKSSIQHQKHRAPKTPQKGRDHAKCNSLSSACNYRGRRPAAAQPSPAGAGVGAHVLLIQLALP